MAELQDIFNSGDLSAGFFGDKTKAENKMAILKDIKAIIGSGRLATDYTITITKPNFEIAAFDTVVIETPGVEVNEAAHTITVEQDGYYKMTFSFNGYFSGNDTMKIMPFINGVEYSSNYILKAGEGTNDDIVVSWTSITPLVAGDVLDLRIGNDDLSNGNITLHVKRLFFGVELIK